MVSNPSKQFAKMRLRRWKGSREDEEVAEGNLRMQLAQSPAAGWWQAGWAARRRMQARWAVLQ